MPEITMCVSDDSVGNIVREDLLESYRVESRNPDFRKSLRDVIHYYSTPSQWVDFCNKEATSEGKNIQVQG